MQRVTMTDVYEEIGRWAPWDTAEEWDNVGVLVQGPDEVVTGICCMLDITPEAVAWAAEKGCNLVLSHHPVIFRPMKKLSRESVPAVLVRNGDAAGTVGGARARLAGYIGCLDGRRENGSDGSGCIRCRRRFLAAGTGGWCRLLGDWRDEPSRGTGCTAGGHGGGCGHTLRHGKMDRAGDGGASAQAVPGIAGL